MSSTAKIVYPLITVATLVLLPLLTLTGQGVQFVFAVVIPYLALVTFFAGFVYRIIRWANSPVPFAITTVGGQEMSLKWIKNDSIESPHSYLGVAGRMIMEVLFFRSLFRNNQATQVVPLRLAYSGNRWLWLGGLAFHWSLLIILFRHLRFFTNPVFPPVLLISDLDGIFQLAIPTLFITDFIIVIALTYLFLRRAVFPQIRYISLPSDYLALLLLLGVVVSGILIRSIFKVDLISVKELALSVITFHPVAPPGIGLPFYIHLMLVCALLAYFPFSKMIHAPGILFSPTRNLKNDSRAVRRINPWSKPVRVHTYEEYEGEFRKPMKAAGIPVEKEA